MTFFRPDYKTLDKNGTLDGDNFEWFWTNDSIHDSNMRAVFYLQSDRLAKLISKTKGKILKRIFKQSVMGSRKVFIFPQHHRFYETFDRKIVQLVTAGIINHLASEFKDVINTKRFSRLKSEEVEPMSLEHLEAGFVIWLVSMIFPIVAFAFEWVVTFKSFIVFERIFEEFIKSLENNARNRNKNMTETLIQKDKPKRRSSQQCESPKIEFKPNENQTDQFQVSQIDTPNEEDNTDSIFGEVVHVEVHEEPINNDLIVTDL
jgi:hypothetical protein